jgi:hypothetical protein
MPVTVDATVGGAHANSYVSVADADAYCNTRLYASAWTNLSDADTKARALITATGRIDEVPYDGQRVSATQRLQWPRYNVLKEAREYDALDSYYAADEIPREIKEAVIEYAITMLEVGTNVTRVSPLSKFKSLAVPGGLQLTMRDDADAANDALPPVVLRKLAQFMAPIDTVRIARA